MDSSDLTLVEHLGRRAFLIHILVQKKIQALMGLEPGMQCAAQCVTEVAMQLCLQ